MYITTTTPRMHALMYLSSGLCQHGRSRCADLDCHPDVIKGSSAGKARARTLRLNDSSVGQTEKGPLRMVQLKCPFPGYLGTVPSPRLHCSLMAL